MRDTQTSRLLGWFGGAVVLAIGVGLAVASTDQLVQQGVGKVQEGVASQARVDKIVDSQQERLLEYRSLLKQVDGLKAYNKQLSEQVQAQLDLIQRFDKSIGDVALIERQIAPLVDKMALSLEEFVELDLPFHWKERAERVAYLKEQMASAKVNVSEKFRQVLEVYQIENEFGRNIDSYSENIMIDGQEVEVDVLMIGRVALLAQTKDQTQTYRYDHNSGGWQPIDAGDYRNSVRAGIKMAQKQAPIDVLTVPVAISGE